MLKQGSEDRSSESVRPSVYVVDDNREMCLSLDALLSSYDFDVTFFTNPVEFVERRSGLRPGVVLLDLRMPDMSGMDVLAAINGEFHRFPTIVITAHGEIDAAVRAIKLGAKDFIQKPFREKTLLAAINYAFEGFDADSGERAQLLDDLSSRERDVVVGLSRGVPNKVVAYQLGISVRTVEMHRARAMQKLGCKTFADLLRVVFRAIPSVP